jgi:adenylate kinase
VAAAAEPSVHGAARGEGTPPDGARVVFLGPPNSGKGTQAKIVGERLGVPAISTGEMLREAVDEGSPLGRQVAATLAAGELVDDETMARVVRERLARRDTGRGFVLDGYPRTLAQAETLERILGERGESLGVALLIDAPEDELVARALGRGRQDDREEVMRERLRVYRERTAPLIGYYEERGLLRRVDGDHPVEEVTSRIFAELGVPNNVMARG